MKIVEYDGCNVQNRRVMKMLDTLLEDQHHLIEMAQRGFVSERLLKRNEEIRQKLKKVQECR